jgi:hypothetical protein
MACRNKRDYFLPHKITEIVYAQSFQTGNSLFKHFGTFHYAAPLTEEKLWSFLSPAHFMVPDVPSLLFFRFFLNLKQRNCRLLIHSTNDYTRAGSV